MRLQDPKQCDSPLDSLPCSTALSVSPCHQRGDTHHLSLLPVLTNASVRRTTSRSEQALPAAPLQLKTWMLTQLREKPKNHKLAQQATVCPQGHTKYHVLEGSRSSEDLAAPEAQRLQKWLCWCQIWSFRSFPATAERTARVAMLGLATAVLSTASGHWPP